MKKILPFVLWCTVIATGCVYLRPSGPAASILPKKDLEPFRRQERVLILAPHPDDETIGCAGVIQKALAAGAEVKVVYLTNGDHNQVAFIVYEKRLTFRKSEFIHMGQVRCQEAVRAMKFLGLDESRLVFLGYPDFGTFAIFKDFWRTAKPYQSMLTHISSVPYKQNLSFGVPYTGDSILADIKKVLRDYQPNKIFVSHPSDTNVDHKALYLFLQIALSDLEGKIPRPKVYPYLIHCPGWPTPRHYHPDLVLSPPKQYPLEGGIDWLKSGLTPAEKEAKHKAILCYKSQTESSAFYLLAFARQNELFGNYPNVELDIKKALSGRVDMAEDSDTDELEEATIEARGRINVAYECDGVSFYIRIRKPDELDKRFNCIVYLFGYSYRTPFASMPKIRIVTSYHTFKMWDSRRPIRPQAVTLNLNPGELTLKIPLAVLGNPDTILTSLKTYGGRPRINSIGFRKITIRRR